MGDYIGVDDVVVDYVCGRLLTVVVFVIVAVVMMFWWMRNITVVLMMMSVDVYWKGVL